MYYLLAETGVVPVVEEASLELVLQWLPWIVLVAAFVAVVLAVLVKSIYLFLHIFSKKG